MTDKPIIFSAPMVRAILDGRKTQTRRVLKRARVFATPECPVFTLTGDDMARALQNASRFRHIDGDGWFWESDAFPWQAPAERTGWMAHIGYAPGDRLWVREAWRTGLAYEDLPPSAMGGDEQVLFECDGETDRWSPGSSEPGRLRPSIHMPRWASRITLEVTDVRVQRLREISEEDAHAEGLVLDAAGGVSCYRGFDGAPLTPSAGVAFRDLWQSIHGPGSWDKNPWVVAVTFRRIP